MIDATYVINLNRAATRWNAAQRTAASAGLRNVIRFPALDGQQLDERAITELQERGRLSHDLSAFDPACRDAEIGCAISHALVLEDILARGWRTALVLEDDVELTGSAHDWPARFRAAHADLPTGWELWYLHRCFDIRHRVRRISSRTVIPWSPQSGAAYAVTAHGAEILLAAISPLSRAVDLVYMDVVKARRIASFAASPMLFDPALGDQPSQIRAHVSTSAWLEQGVNRPPEYWPARYLPHLGEPTTVTALLAEWWYRGRTALHTLWPSGGAPK